ncbi:hypothetical protein H4219_001163 [Mycoemilia scoparia]|uniref:Sugar phosphate transporter domain-containing protein n=1 Tax=Mycoemilia scoparia TaxID=417184 RepID=A0A9W8A5I2_9FUNG|nr:hypothetical protein H4219_001163 [Mycoemilia scoparia]
MCKSSAPAFVLVFAVLFGVEKFHWRMAGIIAVISAGVFLMAAGEVHFVFSGFVQVMLAAMMGGLRWSLTQILLKKASLGMNNPVATILFLSPVMGISLFFLSLIIERPFSQFGWTALSEFGGLFDAISLMAIGGLLAFMMVLSEFAIISRTSAVTLSIAGIFKEIITVIFSVMVFGDTITFVNMVGLLVAFSGIIFYNLYKIQALSAQENGALPVPTTLGDGHRNTTSIDDEPRSPSGVHVVNRNDEDSYEGPYRHPASDEALMAAPSSQDPQADAQKLGKSAEF